jgi:hypothetical protein
MLYSQYVYSVFSGHPNKTFVDDLQFAGVRKIIYLNMGKEGNNPLLFHSGVYFHDCPNLGVLIKKDILGATKHNLYLAYEEEFVAYTGQKLQVEIVYTHFQMQFHTSKLFLLLVILERNGAPSLQFFLSI